MMILDQNCKDSSENESYSWFLISTRKLFMLKTGSSHMAHWMLISRWSTTTTWCPLGTLLTSASTRQTWTRSCWRWFSCILDDVLHCALPPRVSVVMLVGIYLSLTSLGQSRRAGQILFSFLYWNGRGLIVMPACYSSMGTYRLCRAFNPTLSSAYRELALNSLLIYSCSLLRIPWRRRRPGTWWGPNLRSATRAARTGWPSAWWFEGWWEF